ncbi:MAG: zinc ribbon domain-containing protein [Candidatus Marinimicrobia bacterium]|nr:zinc ribbon domain-containing protein [Candidatus Neomarinimicrobiota bacterium]
MPTYDYICNSCKKMYKYFQSMSDDALTKCPECKKDSLRRVISGGTGLIFKGSGYYLTDYKNQKDNPDKKDSGSKKQDKKSKKKKEVGKE